MRKLATIRKVDKLLPIKNKDRIELAIIGGWSCIVKKGEFDVDSLGVFFEIDSFLPHEEPFLFLGKPITHQGRQGYRIKTMKMSGCISQGLLLPFSSFTDQEMLNNVIVGDDVTDFLGVIKYDVELTQNGKSTSAVTGQPQGKFPDFIPKTDQERIQNLPHYFEVYKHTQFEETLKLDGSSCTMYKIEKQVPWYLRLLKFLGFGIKSTHFGVCSRNLELKRPEAGDKQSNFWDAATKYNIEEDLPHGYAIQGEVLAPNIQGNFEKVSEVEYYIFNVYDINARQYLSPSKAKFFVDTALPSAKYVPIISTNIRIFEECQSFESLQEHVTGYSMNQPISEGRVYKSENGVSFKCISNRYLLKSGK
jgi:RNA ligase (TIGR02306 family)